MPKVSVVIPTYNRSDKLKDALASVLKQTYDDYEIVVIDDGSTDNTKWLVSQYVKRLGERIRYVYQENQGPGAARNKGIQEALGTYVAFLDSDDAWLPRKLEKQMNFIEENPAYVLVYTDAVETQNGEVIKKSKIGKNDRNVMTGFILDRLIMGCVIFLSSVLVRKYVLQQLGGFKPELKIGQDWELWLRVSKEHKMAYLDEVLMEYVRHEENRTNNIDLVLTQRHKILKEALRSGLIPKSKLHLVKKAHSKIDHSGACEYFNLNDKSNTRRQILRSMRWNCFNGKNYPLLMKTFLPRQMFLRLRELKASMKG